MQIRIRIRNPDKLITFQKIFLTYGRIRIRIGINIKRRIRIKPYLTLHDVHGPLGNEAGALDLLARVAETLHKPGLTISHLNKLNGTVSLPCKVKQDS
jgi:hypothetical protein